MAHISYINHKLLSKFKVYQQNRELHPESLRKLLYVSAFTRGGLNRLTAGIDHVSIKDTPGSTVLHVLAWDFQPVLSPSREAKKEVPGLLDCRCSQLQLACSPISPQARPCGPKEDSDQFALRTWPNQRSLLCAGILVRGRWCRSYAIGTQSLCFTCGMRWMLSLSKIASVFSSASRLEV